MQDYIHHTNGRIRIKSKAFYGNLSLFKAKLYEQKGVREIQHNKYAYSITIHYDPTLQNGDELLAFISKSWHTDNEKSYSLSRQPHNKRRSPVKTSVATVTSRAGQIAFAMLLEKGVRYSMRSILGV